MSRNQGEADILGVDDDSRRRAEGSDDGGRELAAADVQPDDENGLDLDIGGLPAEGDGFYGLIIMTTKVGPLIPISL